MLKKIWTLITSSYCICRDAKASRMSAAMTYYTMLSLAPLLTMTIAIAGFVFGDQLAKDEVIERIALFTTDTIAETVAGLIRNATRPATGIVAGVVSLAVLAFGASGVFAQLYDTFNEIWQVPREDRRGFLFLIRKRLVGVLMVLIAGILLLAAIVFSTVLGTVKEMLHATSPPAVAWLQLADRGVSYLLMPLVLSLIFWLVPAAKIRWQDAWPAGILASLLVAGSRHLINLYIQFSSTSEVYGAAGSLVVLLIWVYVNGLIVFLGASFSCAWSRIFGSRSGTDGSD